MLRAQVAKRGQEAGNDTVGFADGFLDLMSAFEMQQHPVPTQLAKPAAT